MLEKKIMISMYTAKTEQIMWDVENFLGRTVFGQNVRISMKIERPYCFRTLEKKATLN